jgi:diguanylate cyclase (GGDEF)-like protein
MNGLKSVNDNNGHDQGDELLRRAGNILSQLIQNTLYSASRIGGDEFVVLLPGADQTALQTCLDTLNELVVVDNQFYSQQKLLLAIGSATTDENERVEDMLKRADQSMYVKKYEFYESQKSENLS